MAETYGYILCSAEDTKEDIREEQRELLRLGVPDLAHIHYEYGTRATSRGPSYRRFLHFLRPGDTLISTSPPRMCCCEKQLRAIASFALERQILLVQGPLAFDCRDDFVGPMILVGGIIVA